MLLRLLKHDIRRNVEPFFGMSAVLLVVAFFTGAQNNFATLSVVGYGAFFSLFLIACVISFMIMYNSYRKTVFGDNGYLTLTLPIKRSTVLLSKMISAILWTNFMIIVVYLAFELLMRGSLLNLWYFTNFSQSLADYFMLNIVAFFTLSTMHMGITLSNSAFNSVSINRWLGHSVGIGYFIFGMFIATYVIDNLLWGFSSSSIIVASSIVVVDRAFLLSNLAFGLIAYFITLYLLNKRLDLK